MIQRGAMKKQRGLTLTGMILTSIGVVLMLILAFKLVPVYLEYQTVQRLFKSMADDPQLRKANRGELERSWYARTSIDNVKSLPAENIEYTHESDGSLTITAEYSVKVPLFRNINLLVDFKPSSK
jgi:hypothetical protein